MIILVVFANAKILILKLITTNRDIQRIIDSCICQCKDTNFKANHNLGSAPVCPNNSCICQCKDTNFKANHNLIYLLSLPKTLYLPMQRY